MLQHKIVIPLIQTTNRMKVQNIGAASVTNAAQCLLTSVAEIEILNGGARAVNYPSVKGVVIPKHFDHVLY